MANPYTGDTNRFMVRLGKLYVSRASLPLQDYGNGPKRWQASDPHAWLTLPAQMVDATLARSLLAGVSNPNVFLGR